MVKLSIIILSYNTQELTLKCLRSIITQYKRQVDNKEFELILVDNGSEDGTVTVINNSELKEENMHIIKNKNNFGFSKGNNMGVQRARGKYLLFLNSDTEMPNARLVEMIDFLEKRQDAAVVGGALKNYDGSLQFSTGRYYNLFTFFLTLAGIERLGLFEPRIDKITRVDWVCGGFMMVRHDLFQKLGGFDENFFMYLEDMELCYRMKCIGYTTYFYPNVFVFHKGQGSSSRSFAIIHIYKSVGYFYKKHKPYWQYLVVKLLLRLKAYTAIYISKLLNNVYLKETYTKALNSL